MEGVPRISMLSFPLRKSADVPSFRNKLKAYIRDEYKEDADSYNSEINELEALRGSAVHVSKDVSGCSTLKKYFCQLNFLKMRFPIVEGGPCAISFSWFDAFTETVHNWADLEFEMSCVLYNIGALHSELGATDNRQDQDGMKNACTHFQCAAWAFQQMRHNYQNYFTQDISPDSLSVMTNICLAQAQECIFEKSLIDNRKSTITAKVALQIVEYYLLAMKTCDQMLKDSSQYSDKVIKAVKKWRKLVELKSHYYSCISFFYQGAQAEDQSKYGERITFYKAALEKLTEAAKSAKSLDKTDNVHDTIQFTFDMVQGKLAISEKENDFVYHDKVPELGAVSSDIKGVSLVKGIPFKFDDPQIAGPDIFGKLVPMGAHEVSSLYSEEKAKILRHYADKIETKNEALDRMAIALQLDQLDLHSSVKRIPQELVDCCAALSVNKDAVKRLTDAMGKLSGLHHDVEGNLGEIEDLIKEELAKEKDFQEMMCSNRPPSNVIVEIKNDAKRYHEAHIVAAETNQQLHEALSKHVGNLQILMKPFDEVLQHIPAFEEDDLADQEAINQMKKLIGKVDEMRKQRFALETQLRESVHNDDITGKIVVKVESESDLADLFKEELKKHDKISQILNQNLLAQDNIIRALTEANANYAETRKKTVQVMKRRDKIIEDFISSYESYDELLSKCHKGIEFYTKLNTNVHKLLQKARSVCKVQEEERITSVQTLMSKTKAMSLNNATPMPMPGIGTANTKMTMGLDYPLSATMPTSDNFNLPQAGMPGAHQFPVASGGHLKLKDVLALKRQTPNQPQGAVQNQFVPQDYNPAGLGQSQSTPHFPVSQPYYANSFSPNYAQPQTQTTTNPSFQNQYSPAVTLQSQYAAQPASLSSNQGQQHQQQTIANLPFQNQHTPTSASVSSDPALQQQTMAHLSFQNQHPQTSTSVSSDPALQQQTMTHLPFQNQQPQTSIFSTQYNAPQQGYGPNGGHLKLEDGQGLKRETPNQPSQGALHNQFVSQDYNNRMGQSQTPPQFPVSQAYYPNNSFSPNHAQAQPQTSTYQPFQNQYSPSVNLPSQYGAPQANFSSNQAQQQTTAHQSFQNQNQNSPAVTLPSQYTPSFPSNQGQPHHQPMANQPFQNQHQPTSASFSSDQTQSQQQTMANQPFQNQHPPPPSQYIAPQEYDPNNSFLAKYVKQQAPLNQPYQNQNFQNPSASSQYPTPQGQQDYDLNNSFLAKYVQSSQSMPSLPQQQPYLPTSASQTSTDYNPNNSFLAKYVKQYNMGPPNSGNGATH